MRDYGVLLASHGPLAEALLESVRVIAGELEGFETFCLGIDTSLAGIREVLGQKVQSMLRVYRQVLILCDLRGGTPANAASFLAAENPNIRLLTGVNMPMVAELTAQDTLTDDFLLELIEIGRCGICDLGDLVRENRPGDSSTDL